VVDLTRPCVKCGAVNRDTQRRCRPCQKKSQAKYRQSNRNGENRNPTKPCGKCGEVDRDTQRRCRPCLRKSKEKYRQSKKGRETRNARIRQYHQSEKGREAIKARQRRYSQSKKGREARKAIYQNYCPDLTRPCKNCGVVDRYQNGKCRACAAIYRKTYQRSAQYRESQNKRNKLNFEFSLKNQQKVIKQCQQKLTQPNEKNPRVEMEIREFLGPVSRKGW